MNGPMASLTQEKRGKLWIGVGEMNPTILGSMSFRDFAMHAPD